MFFSFTSLYLCLLAFYSCLLWGRLLQIIIEWFSGGFLLKCLVSRRLSVGFIGGKMKRFSHKGAFAVRFEGSCCLQPGCEGHWNRSKANHPHNHFTPCWLHHLASGSSCWSPAARSGYQVSAACVRLLKPNLILMFFFFFSLVCWTGSNS